MEIVSSKFWRLAIETDDNGFVNIKNDDGYDQWFRLSDLKKALGIASERVLHEIDGYQLTYNPDEVVSFEAKAGREVSGPPEERILGDAYASVELKFKQGAVGPRWSKVRNSPDIKTGDELTAELLNSLRK